MREDLLQFSDIADRLISVGKAHFLVCKGSIFPCDALALVVLERALNLLKGFALLLDGGSYACGAALLRLQLDNLLRFSGVASTRDPHETASEMLTGKQLNKIKHKSGQPMTDKYLAELASKRYPWALDIYDLASGYVHLSESHFHHMLMRSKIGDNGVREFHISDTDDYIPEDHKGSIVESFAVISRGVIDVVEEWSRGREQHGTPEELSKRFGALRNTIP